MKTFKLNIEAVIDEASQHISQENDLRWPIGAAIEELYPELFQQITEKMLINFSEFKNNQ